MTKKVNIIYTGRYKKNVNLSNQGFTIFYAMHISFTLPSTGSFITERILSAISFDFITVIFESAPESSITSFTLLLYPDFTLAKSLKPYKPSFSINCPQPQYAPVALLPS